MVRATAREHYPHVDDTANGGAIIVGTTMKVIEIVMAQRAHGWSPEELSFQFPHLSMGQIHGALAYYWDNQERLDEEIAASVSLAESLRSDAGQSALTRRLSALKQDR
jgi:uncharacterized protein (DUF433 family)